MRTPIVDQVRGQWRENNVTRKHRVDNTIAADLVNNQIREILVAHETLICLHMIQDQLVKKGSTLSIKINLEKRNRGYLSISGCSTFNDSSFDLKAGSRMRDHAYLL